MNRPGGGVVGPGPPAPCLLTKHSFLHLFFLHPDPFFLFRFGILASDLTLQFHPVAGQPAGGHRGGRRAGGGSGVAAVAITATATTGPATQPAPPGLGSRLIFKNCAILNIVNSAPAGPAVCPNPQWPIFSAASAFPANLRFPGEQSSLLLVSPNTPALQPCIALAKRETSFCEVSFGVGVLPGSRAKGSDGCVCPLTVPAAARRRGSRRSETAGAHTREPHASPTIRSRTVNTPTQPPIPAQPREAQAGRPRTGPRRRRAARPQAWCSWVQPPTRARDTAP